jgi:hypothetical protein
MKRREEEHVLDHAPGDWAKVCWRCSGRRRPEGRALRGVARRPGGVVAGTGGEKEYMIPALP